MGYLKADMMRLSYSEVWRWGNKQSFAEFCARKLLGWPMYHPVLVPDTPRIFVLPVETATTVPDPATSDSVAELIGCGFSVIFRFSIEPMGPVTFSATALLHADGRTVCVAAASGDVRKVGVGLVTKVSDGTFIATEKKRISFDPPPVVQRVTMQANVPAIVEAHLRRIADREVVTLTPADVEPLILELQRLNIEHNIRRGLFVPVE